MNKKGFSVIGKGKFSSVYENPKFNYILKIFSRKDTAYITFLKLKPDLKCFPKIIGKPVKFNDNTYAVRLEKLTPNFDGNRLLKVIKQIYSDIDDNEYTLGPTISDDIRDYLIEHTDIVEGLIFIKKICKQFRFDLDLHLGNIMFRENYPVIIDPFLEKSSLDFKMRTNININDPEDILTYLKNTNDHNHKLLNIIMKNPEYAYEYARDVIKRRWKEAEPFIMIDPEHAYWYAKHVIKGRWPEAEPIIKKDGRFWDSYAINFLYET